MSLSGVERARKLLSIFLDNNLKESISNLTREVKKLESENIEFLLDILKNFKDIIVRNEFFQNHIRDKDLNFPFKSKIEILTDDLVNIYKRQLNNSLQFTLFSKPLIEKEKIKELKNLIGFIIFVFGNYPIDNKGQDISDNTLQKWINNVFSKYFNQISFPIDIIDYGKSINKKEKIYSEIIRRKKNRREFPDFKGKDDKELIEFLMQLINEGEGEKVEFKSSLKYDYRTKQANRDLKHEVVKTIAGFLNYKGGYLFIGVDDDGDILGLDNDYSLISKKNNKDRFQLSIDNLIRNNFDIEINEYVGRSYPKLKHKEICLIKVSRSENAIFLKNGEFYMRTGGATHKLTPKEAHKYIKNHFK